MSYSDYEGTFDFEEQEGNNYIIYGVRVKYNSKEEADQIWERVGNDSHRLCNGIWTYRCWIYTNETFHAQMLSNIL